MGSAGQDWTQRCCIWLHVPYIREGCQVLPELDSGRGRRQVDAWLDRFYNSSGLDGAGAVVRMHFAIHHTYRTVPYPEGTLSLLTAPYRTAVRTVPYLTVPYRYALDSRSLDACWWSIKHPGLIRVG